MEREEKGRVGEVKGREGKGREGSSLPGLTQCHESCYNFIYKAAKEELSFSYHRNTPYN